tara:strand:- start:279 stop:494 length:216 start_codon:yes stop_codon:yes gene_type:complete
MKLIRFIIKAITWYFITLSVMGAILLVWSFSIENTPVLGYLSISLLYSVSMVMILLWLGPQMMEDKDEELI